ncbi:hypothetical protein PLESTB_001763900 [Pleodorina starrii]|uniref:Succinate dehydrogenase assembly factor 3 n=1 Tax=Pleodorina starrii TaxID=330485 RepID=A0A9W6C1Q9_9CHLO|nr:hypothetical protein PLESTM_002094900 [Pleodorina starrii]GLC61506.1 hypothetical protein PLESTB_001763900 [Pleodorina starrii]GLC77322.1 hypothetical protein PLESTF_001919500 [Pleodorina starrii]
MASRQAAAPIISLYREVLKLHRERLPPPVRNLGDSYVRAEFRSHLRGKTSESQWAQFVREWRGYLATLRGDGQQTPTNATVSSELVSGDYGSLSEDQRKRVELLQKELRERDDSRP